MELSLHRPAGRLAAFVESMTYFAGLETRHQREKLLPDGAIELIVDLGMTPKKLYESESGEKAMDFRRAWISGIQRRPLVIEAQPGSSLFVIRFRPGGAYPVVRFDTTDLTDGVFDFEAVLGALACSLRERILDAATAAAKFAAAECWLGGRIADAEGVHPIVARMAARLGRPGLGVRGVAAEVNLSERHALALFRRHVGITPKQYARIARFNGVLAGLARGPAEPRDMVLEGEPLAPPDWAQLAAAAGYADQSHLTHEFHAFAGMTPGAYAAAHRGLTNYLPIGARA